MKSFTKLFSVCFVLLLCVILNLSGAPFEITLITGYLLWQFYSGVE